MQTLFPSRPRWRERREVEKGGGEEYWRKVSLEEQDSFLPPPRQRHPHPTPPHSTPLLDPPMWRVEPTSALFSRAAGGNDCEAERCLMKVETLVIIIVFLILLVDVMLVRSQPALSQSVCSNTWTIHTAMKGGGVVCGLSVLHQLSRTEIEVLLLHLVHMKHIVAV